MNTRRGRGRQKTTDSPEGETTPLRKNLLTPCRRMGLGRKRNVNSPDLGKTTRLESSPGLVTGEGNVAVSNTPEEQIVATTSGTGLPETPSEPQAKSSSSRRKKSTNPLKRTIEDAPSVSEGNKTIVLLSPVHKKRKLELVDIFNSETTQSPQKSDSSDPQCVVSCNSPSKSDIKRTNFSVKVSLPLELSQKYITSPPKPKTSDKNALTEVLSPETNLISANIKNVPKNVKILPNTTKRNKSKDKLMESDSDLTSNDDFSAQMTDKSLVMGNKVSKRRKNNNKTLLNDPVECDSITSEPIVSLIPKKTTAKTVIANKSKRRRNKNSKPDNCSLDSIPSIIEPSLEEKIVSEMKSTENIVTKQRKSKTKLKPVEHDTLINDSSSDVHILTKFNSKQPKNITKTKNTKRKKCIEKTETNSIPNDLSSVDISTDENQKLPEKELDDENVFRNTKFMKRKNKFIVENDVIDKTKQIEVKSRSKNNKINKKLNATLNSDKKTNAKNKKNNANEPNLIDSSTNLIEKSPKIVKNLPRNSRKKKVIEKVVIEDPKPVVIEEKPPTPIDLSIKLDQNVKKIQNLDEKVSKMEPIVENKFLDDTMPIKKRKMRGKVENLSEDIENFIPCTLIDKSIVNTDVGLKIEGNVSQNSIETSNIVAQIVNDFNDDLEDDFEDFRQVTPRAKPRLTIKKKVIIEKNVLPKKDVPTKKSSLIKNKYLSFSDDLNPVSDISKIRQSKSLPMSSDSEDSVPLNLRKEEIKTEDEKIHHENCMGYEIEERINEVVLVENCDESSLDSSKIEEMIIKQMDQTRKENLANSHDKSLKHLHLDENEENHIGTFEKIISSTINDRMLKSKEETTQLAEEIPKIGSVYDFQSDSNEKVSLLDLRSKRKREGRISIEESEYSSSNYTTPSFSPIDEIVKQSYEKELLIAKNEVLDKLKEFDCERRCKEIVVGEEKEAIVEVNEKIGDENEDISRENREIRHQIIFETNKNIVDEEILNLIEDTRLPEVQIESTSHRNEPIYQPNPSQINVTPKQVNRFEYKSFDEDFEGFNNELLHQKQRLERELSEKNYEKFANNETNLSLLGLKPRAESSKGDIREEINLEKIPENISREKLTEKLSESERIQDLLGLEKEKEEILETHPKIIEKDLPKMNKSENVISESCIHEKVGSDESLDNLASLAVQTNPEKMETIEKIVVENRSEDRKLDNIEVQKVENIISNDNLESLPLFDSKMKVKTIENFETFEKIINKNVTESKKSEKNISEPKSTKNDTYNDRLESLPLKDRKLEVKTTENYEAFEKILHENVTEHKKSENKISEPNITENVTSDDSLESVPLLDRKLKVKTIENFETFEKIVNENVTERKKSEKNISEPKISENIISVDSLESVHVLDHKTNSKNTNKLETIPNKSENKSSATISEVQNDVSNDSLESLLLLDRKTKKNDPEKIIDEKFTPKKSEKNIQKEKTIEKRGLDDSFGQFEEKLTPKKLENDPEKSLPVEKISEDIIRSPERFSQRLRSGGRAEKLLTKSVVEEIPEKITFVRTPRNNRLSLKLKQESKKEVMDNFELKTLAKYEILSSLRVAKVILIPVEYEKRYRKYLTPMRNDDKIYRIPKNLDEETKINRRKKIVKKMDENDTNNVMEKDFEQPSPSRRSCGLKISKIESNYDENDFDAFQKNVKTPKKIELTNKLSVKGNTSREESVFFTPPSSRSENDSDSNRNDFQTESEISPTSSNPFGEGTSKRVTLKELSVSNLTEIIGIPPSKPPRILSPEVIDTMFKKHERSEEDKEVEELVPKSPARRTPSRGKKRKNSTRSSLTKHNLTNESDSEDDFVSPRSQNASKTLIKDESGTKSKIKSLLKKKTDLLNRAENFRITSSSTITALHKGHVVAYVKSHDNDITLKNTESDDNQTVSVRDVIRDTMIVERFSYNRSDRVPSMFDSVVDDPEGYLASQDIVDTPRKKTQKTRTDIKDEIIQTERRIKEKEAKLERLKLIGVYKKTHDLEKLTKLTAQFKKGCQDALLELAAVLRETSYTPFDMATLLHNMHIPNEQVGYNPELDEFL